ncbi:iron(III) ABC transporter ATP-binding protein [Bacteroidia bacterium]|nr:iron(III) ABC transporter ATP-binding protein [Bacteroidia bacterium]
MKTKAIKIRNLSIGYKGKKNDIVIAQGLTSTIYSGELTCLIGANGVGKSTLLRTLSAFQPALSGEIILEEKEIFSFSGSELSKIIGVVLTEKVEVRNLSVTELVGMGRSPYTGFWGKLTQEDEKIVEEAMQLVRIPGLADREVQTLSDGERQKVMIAKALAQQTPVIFLDEPTAFLDFPSKVEILQTLHRLSRETNKTIFLSTHDLELALQIADKIWLMDKEKGLTTGSREELVQTGSFEDFFQSSGVIYDYETHHFKINKHIQ